MDRHIQLNRVARESYAAVVRLHRPSLRSKQRRHVLRVFLLLLVVVFTPLLR